MTLSRKTFLGLASAAALSLGLGASSVAAQEVTLSLHQFLPAAGQRAQAGAGRLGGQR